MTVNNDRDDVLDAFIEKTHLKIGDINDANGLFMRIQEAVERAWQSAQVDGSHHRIWVINQMLIALLGDDLYNEFVEAYEKPLPDGDYYEWDKGIPP